MNRSLQNGKSLLRKRKMPGRRWRRKKAGSLDQMTDGIITADTRRDRCRGQLRSGRRAGQFKCRFCVFMTPNMVFVTIAVPQEDIALMQVGDTVEVKRGRKTGDCPAKLQKKPWKSRKGIPGRL